MLCKILLLIQDIQNDVSDMFDAIMELICFLISCDNKREYVNIIEHFSKRKAKNLLNLIKDNRHNYKYKVEI